jgi:hypothetical protein
VVELSAARVDVEFVLICAPHAHALARKNEREADGASGVIDLSPM